jgi:hypothetical protein
MDRYYEQCKKCKQLVMDDETDDGEVYDWCKVEEDIESCEECQKFCMRN